MAMLDFIKNRQSQQQATVEPPKPENAKKMYTREASQEKAAAKSVEQLSVSDKASVSEIRQDLHNAIRSVRSQDTVISGPADGDTAPQAMRQNMSNQDKAAPSLSPTSEQVGKSSVEQEATKPSRAKSQERAQTIARPAPSWER